MRVPLSWLAEWVDIPWEPAELARRLTASGFEVEGIENDSAGDSVLELKTYANRGDSMSVLGVAREVAALTGGKLKGPAIGPVPASAPPAIPAVVEAPRAAPRLLTRRLEGLSNRGESPPWLRERLRLAGLRPISPVVDITNYVLLELGQPMHAYDAACVKGALRVRAGRAGEKLTLLDERVVDLAPDVLAIADDGGPIGLAGIMGGQGTAIAAEATEVLLEVAFFAPEAIAGRARRYGFATDASQRFERGVDPEGQHRALDRATSLLLSVCGGRAGPVHEVVEPAGLPARPPVTLRRVRLELLSGAHIPDAQVESTLKALGMRVVPQPGGWVVTPPSWRFDLAIEADLIEEVLRIIGFEAVQEQPRRLPQRFTRRAAPVPDERALLDALCARGYQETINYAFVDPALQEKLFPAEPSVRLANPIAADLAAMRVSLWPGLVKAALANLARQQDRVRLFERGAVFLAGDGAVREAARIGGIVVGPRAPEQWGAGKDLADFFDVKSDVTALLELAGPGARFQWQTVARGALHPGRGATIERDGVAVGWLGELHPSLAADLGFASPCMLFELDITQALVASVPQPQPVSRYPQVRRDLAVTVPVETPLSTIAARVNFITGELLRELVVFDVYQGAGIESTRKSIAFGLIFQDNYKTLTDDEADTLVASVAADLGSRLGARIR